MPLLKQFVPILEIETSSFKEDRHTPADLLGCHSHRAHIHIAVKYAVIDPVGRRNKIHPCIVLSQAFDSEFNPDSIKRAKYRRPVLRVTEPETRFLSLPASPTKRQKIWLEFLPAFGPFWRHDLIWADKPLVANVCHTESPLLFSGAIQCPVCFWAIILAFSYSLILRFPLLTVQRIEQRM